MADSQSLFDTLAGGFGHGVDRQGLNAFVANSQANNGLRSAQTDLALTNAQRNQESLQADNDLENSIASSKDPNGNPYHTPSEAHELATLLKGKFGNSQEVMKAMSLQQENRFTGIAGDPNKLGTPEQTAAFQGLSGKAAPLENVPNNYAVAPGAPAPNVQVSPQGAATIKNLESTAGLHDVQAAAGGFNPHTAAGGGTPDPSVTQFGGYKLFKTGQMPPLGMGSAGARASMIAEAARLSQLPPDDPDVNNAGFDTAIANGQDFAGSQRAITSFAGGQLGNQTRFLNNSIGHLGVMRDLVTALGNGDVQLANKAKQAWAKQFGSDAPTNLQAAAEIIGPEIQKQLSGTSAGTKEERQALSNTAGGLANAPEQSSGAINTMIGLLARQGNDLALQYHGATGRSDFAQRYLAPDVNQRLNNHVAITTGNGLPSYPDEAAARAAGHKDGDRVIIGGVPGMLQ